MKIEELIIREINKKKKINVSRFIELCQFEKDGYYINNNPGEVWYWSMGVGVIFKIFYFYF